MERILIKTKSIEIQAELNETQTAKAILAILPLTAKANIWGEEIYFPVPLRLELEKRMAKEIVEPGELGYWPDGCCFCIFFGPTPASRGKEIRAASPVNIFGKVTGDLRMLKQVLSDTEIKVERQ
jgi:hypothetical protein